LTFATTLLGCGPKFQTALQAEHDTPASDLSYKDGFAGLMDGHISALLKNKNKNRLYTTLPLLPKINKDKSQSLKVVKKKPSIR
jgi:hypothetical protein